MKMDDITNRIINDAYIYAKNHKHEYFTPEHILNSMLYFNEARKMIEGCGGNLKTLKKDLEKYFYEYVPESEREPIETEGLRKIFSNISLHALNSSKKYVNFGDILIAIYKEEDLFASYFLKNQGLKEIDILEYISHGREDDDEYELFDEEYEDDDIEDEEEYEEDSFLEKFSVDLTLKAENNEIDPVIGREDILKRTIQTLCRRLKNNPIHVGEPGVGKTAITEGLAKLITEDKVPNILKGSKIFHIDMANMVAGTKYRGDFEIRIKKVFKELENIEKAIVYIDEIHTIVGAGAVSGGTLDASNILKPYLSSGKIRFIGATTYDEYKKFFEKDKALSRRFQKIEVPEPNVEDTFLILKGLKEKYENYHNVNFTEKALKSACELSSKYINDRFLPDKAIDVIDEAGAYVRIKYGNEENITIDEDIIEEIISSVAKIPKKNVSKTESDLLKTLQESLKKEIFGQDSAIEKIVKAIKISRAGLVERDKPVASFLFVGPTGVGKTEISKSLAKILGIPLVRFDMSEYQEKHTVARLIGSPPGYVGYEEGGLLTDSIKKNPYCVLLLDEIEKAHSDIYNVLLQVMDYANLTDNTGRKADFKNVILIMTSNAGTREIGRNVLGFGDRIVGKDNVDKEIEKTFSPEFRNRIDSIVLFNRINMEMALSISKKAIIEISNLLKNKKIEITATEEVYANIAETGLSSEFGAREIYRIVHENIKTKFVDEILFGELSKGGKAELYLEGKEIKLIVKEKENADISS